MHMIQPPHPDIGSLRSRIRRDRQLYFMLVPVMAYFIIFKYWPMYGVQIAFRQFVATKGISGSQYIGLANFDRFFRSAFFWRLIRNTITINITTLVFSFPAPIILAIMINETTRHRFAKTVQMVTYAPHFLSMTVIVGMMNLLFATQSGIVNILLKKLGLEAIPFLTKANCFLPLYVASGIWQQTGWNSVIYIAAIAGIDYTLYEAAYLDGAGTLQRIWHVTLPCIKPTIVILLIMRMGSMMNVGFEKVFLMSNDLNREMADVISTYVYRIGLAGGDFSYSSAVDLFTSVINFGLLVLVNRISRKLNETSLW